MTEWTTRPERHVPEEEFHAYFDQALSRSQCAEIETHLSSCASCQSQRAAVAALRDRTTALLAQLGPRPVIVPPDYQVLLDRRSHRLRIAMWRARIQRAGMWAAGIAAAAGSGWIARSILDPHRISLSRPSAALAQAPKPSPRQSAPIEVAAVPISQDSAPDLEDATPAPIPDPRRTQGRPTFHQSSGPVVPAPNLQLASVVIDVGAAAREPDRTPASHEDAHNPFDRIWRSVSWEDALRVAGSGLPFIEGMTVVGVLFQPGATGERPTVIVSQQDLNGEVVQSIEGPVEKVTELLQRQAAPDVHASEAARTPPDYVEGPGGSLRRALRILYVTGRLPVDSLNALARLATLR